MISITHTKKQYWNNDVEGYIVFLTEDFDSVADITKIEKEYYPHVKTILRKHKFKGKVGESFVLTGMKDKKLVQFIFVGAGKREGLWDYELEQFRRVVGAAIKRLKQLDVKSAVLQLPSTKPFKIDALELAKQITITVHMADYEFTTFKSDKKEKEWSNDLFIVSDKNLKKSIEQAELIANAVNDTRTIADMPPNIATPTYVSNHAKKIASKIPGLKYTVFGRDKAKKLGMGGFVSVDSGSEQDGKFVILEYDPGKKDAKTIALVGKGVTFDSGGISLKPSSSMSGMKYDMSGAAAVIGAMSAIAKLKPKVRVVGIMPLVENMPSGKANKQDDIVTFMNGKTAEINNTDAEGRLILADALCYAEKFYKPDVIVDLATLTGACLYATGHFFTALMTKDEKLSKELIAVGKRSGDRLWPLPFDDDFKAAIKSDVADISNTGASNYKAGTITAGFFLSNFVDKTPWAHLDIAGTADGVPGINYLGKGATGVGVRLLVDFVLGAKI